jgi:hypothetical protein
MGMESLRKWIYKISPHEMQYFYEEQYYRVEQKSECDSVNFSDLICTLYDMIKPEIDYQWTIKDFLNNRQYAPIFFNSLVNVQKFVNFELRDPVNKTDFERHADFLSDWDKFVFIQYNKLTDDDADQEDVIFK